MGRLLDAVCALAAIIVLLPVLLLIAAAIVLSDGHNPIFVQQRLGLGGRLFPCMKFRSMVPDAEERLHHLLATDPSARMEWDRDQKLRDDPRITPLGAFLRKTSLDELPQLFNVLIGDMSLVGPRPIVPKEAARYGRYIQDYYRVRPGITGLWQVSGRNDVSYRRRVAIDTHYSRSRSLGLNMAILTLTIPAVLSRRGAS